VSVRQLVAAAAIVLAAGCAPPAAPGTGTSTAPAPSATVPPGRVPIDSTAANLIPPGFGTLRQDEISIVLQPENVRVSLLPLDESVIRTLAPDSYRTLRATVEDKRQQIIQRAQMRGIREPRVWYARFYGLAPNARFVPTDITVTSGGRDYRPFDVIPITPAFGEQRLQPRETQAGLLLFDQGVDVDQPLVVTMGADRNTDWSNDPTTAAILSKIEAERSSIRARAGTQPRPGWRLGGHLEERSRPPRHPEERSRPSRVILRSEAGPRASS